MNQFVAELRARKDQGYSVRQLMRSHIPDIGTEIKILDGEVTAAVKKLQADQFGYYFWTPPGQLISFLLTARHY